MCTSIYFTYIANKYYIMKEAFLDLQVKIQKIWERKNSPIIYLPFKFDK